MNILIPYTDSIAIYRGIYYNSANDLIYMASIGFLEIHVFNLDLRLTDTISISPYRPWSINGYNNQSYVGTTDGIILVIVNKSIVKQFNARNGQSGALYSILFDKFYNIATACGNKQLYLYNTNGSSLNKSIPTVDNPNDINFDSKSRLLVVTWTQITVYN